MFDLGIWESKIENEKESKLSELLLRRFLSIVLICKYKYIVPLFTAIDLVPRAVMNVFKTNSANEKEKQQQNLQTGYYKK